MNDLNDYIMFVSIISNVSAIAICYYFLNGILDKKVMPKILKYAILICLAFLFIGILLIYRQSIIFVFVSALVFSLISLIFFQGHIAVRLFFGLLFLIFGIFCEFIAGVILSVVFSFPLIELQHYTAYYAAVVVFSKILLLMIVYFLFVITKRGAIPSVRFIWILVSSIPISSLIVSLNLYVMVTRIEGSACIGIMTALTLIYINIVFFAILKVMKIESEKTVQYKNENIQLEFQQQHYHDLLETNHEVRAIWHDMNNHLITLQYLIDKCAYDEINSYLDQLLKNVHETDKHNISGNYVVDAILGNKIKVAEQNDIKFIHSISMPEVIEIDNVDFSILLGNIIDNAIEGCLRAKPECEKIIKLNLRFHKEVLLIYVENTCDIDTITEIDHSYISSKKKNTNKRGYGITNINYVLDKYEGNIVNQIEKNRFISTILIPFVKETEQKTMKIDKI
ncbi:sensor histidine kinase [Acetobacterium woodii]|uniref:Sensor histidine kinase NatK-like C-terminal domain-containing protein n=1 Tax=Acetobacterium woodii (strain ATCC 29683 / DSM 1030 / JCM 2381 / KCTC 1655 / WB1) TaxID=931626 RepID=H6LHB4_ACEWD|nr:sensor histidine kinase [Acetobacterium woodii]AFA48452.1 hypothetical protein Awo_c16700 [Acetobacterium woodii DSM 1030]